MLAVLVQGHCYAELAVSTLAVEDVGGVTIKQQQEPMFVLVWGLGLNRISFQIKSNSFANTSAIKATKIIHTRNFSAKLYSQQKPCVSMTHWEPTCTKMSPSVKIYHLKIKAKDS